MNNSSVIHLRYYLSRLPQLHYQATICIVTSQDYAVFTTEVPGTRYRPHSYFRAFRSPLETRSRACRFSSAFRRTSFALAANFSRAEPRTCAFRIPCRAVPRKKSNKTDISGVKTNKNGQYPLSAEVPY